MTETAQEAEERYTDFVGTFAPGSHELYLYVDAYNPGVEEGLVVESEEGNNLLGPIVIKVGGEESPSSGDALQVLLKELLEILGRWFDALGERLMIKAKSLE